ncbi:hypothetical protein ACG873_17100 [Mesorhizobium sp. AaZ16]|uniref:DinB/UmuC family translesion DNA polymerase n=1 Tax=Mesorhizobium sp. AaZ16 TaxID=3402289 RepID=UPI00374F3D90
MSRSRSVATPITAQAEIEHLVDALLEPIFPVTKGFRLLEVTMSSLGDDAVEHERQLSLGI